MRQATSLGGVFLALGLMAEISCGGVAGSGSTARRLRSR